MNLNFPQTILIFVAFFLFFVTGCEYHKQTAEPDVIEITETITERDTVDRMVEKVVYVTKPADPVYLKPETVVQIKEKIIYVKTSTDDAFLLDRLKDSIETLNKQLVVVDSLQEVNGEYTDADMTVYFTHYLTGRLHASKYSFRLPERTIHTSTNTTKTKRHSFGLYPELMYVNEQNEHTFGFGATATFQRMSFGYNYNIVNNGHGVRAGYRIW